MDGAHLQDEVRALDTAAARIRNFQPTVLLPGLLQTAAYARAVLGRGRTDVAAALTARLERQQLLHEPGRRFEFVITEQVLRREPGSGALAGQADRLLSLMTLDTVDVAVLPDGTSSGAVQWNNFVIRDGGDGRATVATELIHGAQEILDEDSVRIYEQVWGEVSAVAARGASARALIGAAGTES